MKHRLSTFRLVAGFLRYYWLIICFKWRSTPLGKRLVLWLLTAILCMLCLYSFFTRNLAYRSLAYQRDAMLHQALRIALTLIEQDQKQFLRTCQDYSTWRGTRDAVLKRDRQWLEDNILDWVPTQFDVEGIVILDRKGKPLYFTGLHAQPMIQNPLVQKALEGVSTYGWLIHEGMLYQIASVPILGDDFELPYAGAMVFIDRINQRSLFALSNQVSYKVSLISLTNQRSGNQAHPSGDTFTTDDENPVLSEEGTEVKLSMRLKDVYDRPAVLLSLKTTSNNAQMIRRTMDRAGIQLFGVGVLIALLIGVMVLTLLRRVLQPFVYAANRLAAGAWESRVTYHAGDEFGVLARAFNQMASELQGSFERLQEQQEEIEQQKDELERLYQGLQNSNDALRSANMELLEANQRLEEAATTDGLTGLRNHRTFQEALLYHSHMAQRYHQPLSLILLDLDFFKQYNDAYGHPAGDRLLQQVAGIMRDSARVYDIAARYGGEEFALLLPNTDLQAAVTVAERIRAQIEQAPCEFESRTASLGVASLQGEATAPGILLDQADRALYQAKRTGRNRVCVYEDLMEGKAS